MRIFKDITNKMLASIVALLIVLSVCPTFTLSASSADIVNLSQGKPYTTARYINPEYPDTNGTELTDGNLAGTSYTDSRWTATTADKTNSGYIYDKWPLFSVTIDLQGIKSITQVSANFLKDTNHSIGLPRGIKVFASEDGENWMKLSYLNNINNSVSSGKYSYGWHITGTNGTAKDLTGNPNSAVKARYVRFDFEHYASGHNFIDEVTVMGYDTITNDAISVTNTTKLEDGETLRSGEHTNYVQDMILVYQNPGYIWNKTTLKPHLAYIDTNGNVLDTLYDTVLFLAQTSEAQKNAGQSQALSGENSTVTIDDWNWYIDRTFVGTDSDINTLNETAKQVSNELNDPDYKVNLVIMIPYPSSKATNFGTVDGRKLDLSVEADWKYLIDWYCDTVLDYIDNGDYQYIDFKGFYWMNEYATQISRIQYATAHVKALGYKTFWIPYFNSRGYFWNEDLGFDVIALQPNHLFNDPSADTLGAGGTKVITTAAQLGAYANMAVEFEINSQMLSQVPYYNNGLDYFNGAVENGFAGPGVYRPWYGGNKILGSIAYSKVPNTRLMYTNIYNLIKGNYKTKDYITHIKDNLLLGKSYTHNVTSWYSDNTNDQDCAYLTDGADSYMGSGQNTTITFDFANNPISFKELYFDFVSNDSKQTKLPKSMVISYKPSASSDEWVDLYSGSNFDTQSVFGSDISYTAYGLRLDIVKNSDYVGIREIMAFDEVTGIYLNGKLLDNKNVLYGKSYTHDVTTYDNVSKDPNGTSLTDGVLGGDWSASDYLNAKQSTVSVEFDLGKNTEIGEIYIRSLQSTEDSINCPKSVVIYRKQNGEWHQIYEGNMGVSDFRISTNIPVSATNLKFDFTSDGDYIFIKEIEAYKEATGATVNGNIILPDLYPEIEEIPGNILAGESYTVSTERYLSGYSDDNGTKLTDGVKTDTYGEKDDEGNRKNTGLLLKNSNSSVTFNFTEPKRIKEIELAAFNYESGSVSAPSRIIVEVKNGNNWREVISEAIERKEIERYKIIVPISNKPIAVEGIRLTFVKGTQNWVIIDEIEAYAVRTSKTPVISKNIAISLEITEGNSLSLSVEAASLDGGMITYQWYKNDIAIQGAISSTYIVEKVTFNDAGSYKVKVKNILSDAISTIDSNTCVITVNKGSNGDDSGSGGDDSGSGGEGSGSGGDDSGSGGEGSGSGSEGSGSGSEGSGSGSEGSGSGGGSSGSGGGGGFGAGFGSNDTSSTDSDSNETTAVKGWTKLKDGTWQYSENGENVKGWKMVNGVWYYFDNNATMQTGWEKVGGSWYYLKSSGAMATGWLKEGNTWYYLKSSGAMATGWFKEGNTWYYLKSSGAMATGWIETNGKWYYLYSSGKMATSTTIGKYKLDASGAWIV